MCLHLLSASNRYNISYNSRFLKEMQDFFPDIPFFIFLSLAVPKRLRHILRTFPLAFLHNL